MPLFARTVPPVEEVSMQRALLRKALEVLVASAVIFSLIALCTSGAPVMAQDSSPKVQVWLTDLGTASRLAPQPDLTFQRAGSPGASTVAVDDRHAYQSMIGFGASLTDSSATLIYNTLSPSQRAALMKDLFDPKDGIGLGMVRQPMGASDFSSTGNYSYDDQPAGGSDATLAQFSIAHDLGYIVPLLQQARALNPKLAIVATPWSPPGWMKTSDSMVGGTLKPADLSVLAQYFARFLTAYNAAGVPVNYVTPQNEPLYIPGGYPGMGMVPADQQAFIRDYLQPAIAGTGLDTKVLAYDHNWEVPGYPETVFSDPAAAAATPGTAWHCYAGDVSAQTAVHNAYPNEETHLTECSGGEWQGTQQQAFDATMSLLVNSPRNYAKDVVLWNMALDQSNGPTNGGCLTCRGVVTITTGGTPTVTKNVDYYALGHLSKFVLHGAVRIGSTQLADKSIEDVAFRNVDGSTVLVAHNTTAASRTFQVLWGDSSFSYTLGAGAAATFRWTGKQTGNTSGYDSLARSVDIPFQNADGSRVQLSYDASQAGFQNAILAGTKQFTYTAPVGASIAAGGPETLLSRSGWVATASSTSPYGDVTSKAIDGDLGTRWSGGHGMANGDWFQVDMGSAQTFSGLLIDSAGSTGDFARGYQVYVSNDGTSWGNAIASGPGAGQLSRVVFPAVTARYVRVVQTGGAGNWWSIAELNAFLATSQPVGSSSVQQRAFQAPDGAAGLAVYNPSGSPASFNVELWTDKSLVYTIPAYGGAIFTWVNAHGGRTAAPVLSSVTPSSGLPGESVVLAGSGFGAIQGASAVRFGSTYASVLSWSDTAITVAVPSSSPPGATTVSVTVTGQTTATRPFTVQSTADALPRAGWVATASSTDPYGDVTSNAIDGNQGTRWSGGHGMASGDWFQVDMGSAKTFTRVVMDSGSSTGDYARSYQVVVSNDGTTWSSPVASGNGNGPFIVIPFPSQTARYVRVIQTGSSGSWWSIAEFYVFA
jgi:O-glycosyl hydrolase